MNEKPQYVEVETFYYNGVLFTNTDGVVIERPENLTDEKLKAALDRAHASGLSRAEFKRLVR